MRGGGLELSTDDVARLTARCGAGPTRCSRAADHRTAPASPSCAPGPGASRARPGPRRARPRAGRGSNMVFVAVARCGGVSDSRAPRARCRSRASSSLKRRSAMGSPFRFSACAENSAHSEHEKGTRPPHPPHSPTCTAAARSNTRLIAICTASSLGCPLSCAATRALPAHVRSTRALPRRRASRWSRAARSSLSRTFTAAMSN